MLEKLEVYGQVPDFSLIERGGRRITLANLRGKVWIVNFFYTECTDTCPLQSANMARLQADLSAEADVKLVSISVDPEHDTPEVLSEYAARFRADPERWLFLTGLRDAIYRLAIEGFRLGVVDQGEKAQRAPGGERAGLGPAQAWAHPVPNPERKPIIHSSRFVLVDRQAQIRGYYHGTDWESLERLRQNVRVLVQEKPKER
ncbi:MAG: SCO family protein [Candidatus Rokubacteria bacterium]|nr:SCO family protein [Candidatus Rokubacteria bacterium]